MIFSKTTPAVLATLFIGFVAGGSALACSTDGWDVVSGDVEVGSPFGTTPPDVDGIPRFEELCALRANAEGYVQSNSPSHSRVRGRFYVYPTLAGARGSAQPPVFKAFSSQDGSGELFRIAYDGGNWIIDATANNGGMASIAALPGWTPFEFDWDPSGSGNLIFWIDVDATMETETGSVDAGDAGTMESVQIGMPEGPGSLSGVVHVDSVELRNETAIGMLIHCDADGNTLLNFSDLTAMYNEQFGGPPVLAPGQPDCDSNGLINFSDLNALYNILFPPI